MNDTQCNVRYVSRDTSFKSNLEREIETRCEKTGPRGFRAVQPQKMARGLKFRISKVEGLYYLCSENKYAYREADLRLCFRICKLLVFS